MTEEHESGRQEEQQRGHAAVECDHRRSPIGRPRAQARALIKAPGTAPWILPKVDGRKHEGLVTPSAACSARGLSCAIDRWWPASETGPCLHLDMTCRSLTSTFVATAELAGVGAESTGFVDLRRPAG